MPRAAPSVPSLSIAGCEWLNLYSLLCPPSSARYGTWEALDGGENE